MFEKLNLSVNRLKRGVSDFFGRNGVSETALDFNLNVGLSELDWLTDAALFIDEELVEDVHDAFVRPEYTVLSETTSESKQRKTSLKGKLEGGGKIKFPQWLEFFLDGELQAKLAAEAAKEKSKTESSSMQRAPIRNAQRLIEDLTGHYLEHYPERIIAISLDNDQCLRPDHEVIKYRSEYLLDTPRVLAFLDLPPLTKLLPTAAEFENNKIELIYKELSKKWGYKLEKPELMQYPDDPHSELDLLRGQRRDYWQEYDDAFSAQDAMIAVESASQENLGIRWIDFRLKLTNEGDTMHLHICPRGKYATGTFGYNLIKRGYKHGLRIVGTLKSEPDMNVLAIYEK